MQSTKTKEFIQQFQPQTLPTSLPNEVRELAMSALNILELPTTKWEEWKYSNLRPILKHQFQPANHAEIDNLAAYLIPDFEANVLVFVNGVYSKSLSQIGELEDTVSVTLLSELEGETAAVFSDYYGKITSPEGQIFSALNTAYAAEGVFIHAKGVVERPIHLLHIQHATAAQSVQMRNLFLVEKHAEVKVLESFHSSNDTPSFRNAVTEIFVKENAGLEYVKLQEEGDAGMMVDQTEISQASDSRVKTYTLSMGGNWIRNNLHFHLKGPNTESVLNGLYMLKDNQHVDNHSLVHHFAPNSYSNELYKGILGGKSTAAFRGKIHVHQPAQKTNAYQSNRNILLTDTASVNTKPQLEIYADDVKCSHGATTGRIEEEALFYLRARGVPMEEAQQLLIHAFGAETLDGITMDAVVGYIDQLITARFAGITD